MRTRMHGTPTGRPDYTDYSTEPGTFRSHASETPTSDLNFQQHQPDYAQAYSRYVYVKPLAAVV